MKLRFNQFKRLLFESILSEDKSRLIDRLVLPDIEDEEEKQKARDEMKAFFKKYNTWENKLDWNKLSSITYSDFEKIRDQITQTKGAQKKEIASNIKAIFKSVGKRKFEIIDENKNWLFVAPLTWEAAVYCDSSRNQGAGAKWCIGYEENDSHWNNYIDNGSSFIMAFNKNYKDMNQKELQTILKFMIEENDGTINVWNQSDLNHTFYDGEFDISELELNKMFDKVKPIFQKTKEEILKSIKLRFKQKIENLKNIKTISGDYFTDKEKELLTTVDIPNNVTSIGNYAFRYCTNLTDVTIPDSVTSIGNQAFFWCTSLTSVTIGGGASIGWEAFSYCDSLTNVTIRSAVTSFGERAFSGCSSLKNITFKDKSINEVKAMNYYPWGIKNPEEVIKVEK